MYKSFCGCHWLNICPINATDTLIGSFHPTSSACRLVKCGGSSSAVPPFLPLLFVFLLFLRRHRRRHLLILLLLLLLLPHRTLVGYQNCDFSLFPSSSSCPSSSSSSSSSFLPSFLPSFSSFVWFFIFYFRLLLLLHRRCLHTSVETSVVKYHTT